MTTLVDLARLLCPSSDAVAQQVAAALEEPAGYVTTHARTLRLRGVDGPVEGLAVLALIDGI